MSPNELLLCLNCASAFSWFLYIFHLTAVKKNLTNAKPDTADPWVSNTRESQKQETREGAGEQDTREGASWGTPLGYFMSVLSRQPARFDPFKGRVLEIPLLAVENRIQHLSRKLQSINPLNCHCTKRRQHLSQCKAWRGPWERSWECRKIAEAWTGKWLSKGGEKKRQIQREECVNVDVKRQARHDCPK